MTNSTMPTFFGRATLVLGKHAHLHGTLQQLRELSAALSDQSISVERVASRVIDEFRSQMLAHFAAEEDDSYFGTLEADSPPMRKRVGALRAEHLAFTCTFEKLSELARDDSRRFELATELGGVIANFQAHEQAENHLIQEFFLRDEGIGG